MKYRINEWLDIGDDVEEYRILFGVQANKGSGWQHCHEDGEPLIYGTLKQASDKIEELQHE